MSIALTYKLKRNCGPIRPFCTRCENSFKKTGCLSVCTDGPTHICLEPKVSLTSCIKCKDDVISRNWLMTYTDENEDVYGPWSILSGIGLNPDPDVNCSLGGNIELPLTLSPNGTGTVFFDLETESYIILFDDGATQLVYSLDTPISELLTGEGCNRVLTFTNINITGSSEPNGSIITLYPLTIDA